VLQKNETLRLLVIASKDVSQFSDFFSADYQRNCLLWRFPRVIKYVATLPCEIRNFLFITIKVTTFKLCMPCNIAISIYIIPCTFDKYTSVRGVEIFVNFRHNIFYRLLRIRSSYDWFPPIYFSEMLIWKYKFAFLFVIIVIRL